MSWKYIKLTRGQRVKVDAADYEWLSQHKWYADVSGGRYYATRANPKETPSKVRMHRVIMGSPVGFEVDHRSTDTLDCRRRNLRVATHAQNRRNQSKCRNNTSGYKGVSWHSAMNKWMAYIRVGSKQICLGFTTSKRKAHLLYKAGAAQYHGDFARSN